MRKGTIIVIISVLLMVGCSNNKKDVVIENSVDMNSKNEVFKVDSYGNTEDNKKLLKDLIIKAEEVEIKGNEFNINNFELRNEAIEKEYIRAINLSKQFANSNSLELIYNEGIQETIAIFQGDNDAVNHLTKICNDGAETIHYFTDEDILNIDLYIGISAIDISNMTYAGVIYKASIINTEQQDFKFENSKLNEFRELIVNRENIINFEKLDLFINKRLGGEYSEELIFLNKLDDNSYEIIKVKNNTVYYKFVYDPKL